MLLQRLVCIKSVIYGELSSADIRLVHGGVLFIFNFYCQSTKGTCLSQN